jgi:DNA primase
VIILFDGDRAGQAAAERSMPLFLAEELWPFFIQLPAGKDPDEVVAEEGAEAFLGRISRAIPLLDHLIAQKARSAQTSAEARSEALGQLAPLFARLPADQLDFYANVVARQFGIDAQLAVKHMTETVREEKARAAGSLRPPGSDSSRPASRAAIISLPVHEEFLTHWMLQEPEEILPAVLEAEIVDWLTHPGLQQFLRNAVAPLKDGQLPNVASLVEDVQDTALQTRLRELMVRALYLGDRPKAQALTQTINGIKEHNLTQLLRYLQGELIRLEREKGDVGEILRLGKQRAELQRELQELIRRSRGGNV